MLLHDRCSVNGAVDRTTCFPERFAAIAAAFPNAVAVADGRRHLDYHELERRSRRLAAALLARGIGAGSVVGVWMPRTAELWVALLGILRAGATYLALEQDWPPERLRYMYERSGAVAAVCGGDADAPDFVRSLQRIAVSTEAQTPVPDLPGIEPDQVAYLIFTSGSTGKPKGVAISHGNLANLLGAMADMLRLSPDDAQLCITALSFDLVIPDLFLPLTVGARCVIASRKLAADAVMLADTLENESISVLQATPHTYKRLLASGWQGSPSLTAIVGGEQVPQSLADNLAERVGVLWHCYGPTETTVWAAARRLGNNEAVTLGDPLPGYVLRVIGRQGQQLDGAGEGELFIGGAGVALGYVAEPGQTAAKFVELPSEAGRFYRTGDLVRRDGAGQLFFLGRMDHQVKVGGYRVELGEIENLALLLEGVEDAAAVVESAGNDSGISLYYTASDSAGPGLDAAMREYFANRLPWYMVPSHIALVTHMPLTPGGKVDRLMLARHAAQSGTTSGSSRLQEQLLRLWQELFPERSVTPGDNFFDIGGDSLAAVRLLTAIDQFLQHDLTLSFVYAYPTVALMAQRLEGGVGTDAMVRRDEDESIVCLRPGEAGRLYCFHPVGGSAMHYRALLDYVPAELGVYGIEAPTLDGVTAPADDVESMAAAYAKRLAADRPGGPYLLAGGSMGGVIALEVARCLSEMGREITAVLMFDSFGPDAAGTLGSTERTPLTPGRLINSFIQRLKNRLQLMQGRLSLRLGRPLAHTLRYRFIELHNLQALRRYFGTGRARMPWAGEVVLIRLPMASGGVYAKPLLGWEAVLDRARVEVEYVNGRHDRLVESPPFGNALQRQLGRLLNRPAPVDF